MIHGISIETGSAKETINFILKTVKDDLSHRFYRHGEQRASKAFVLMFHIIRDTQEKDWEVA
jgi:hypothetical protein